MTTDSPLKIQPLEKYHATMTKEEVAEALGVSLKERICLSEPMAKMPSAVESSVARSNASARTLFSSARFCLVIDCPIFFFLASLRFINFIFERLGRLERR